MFLTLSRLCAFSSILAASTASHAASLNIMSIPTDSSFEIIDSADRRVASGRTPAQVSKPPADKYQVIVRRPGCSPLRFWVDPSKSARDVFANFTLLEQWRELSEEKRHAEPLIQSTQMLAERTGPALLNDLGDLVRKKQNTKLLALLNKYGVTVNGLKGGLRNQIPKPTPKPSFPAPVFPLSAAALAAESSPPLDWNEKTIDEWIEKVGRLRTEVENLRPARDQSLAVQDQYQRLMTDLLELAATDPDAQQIVEKWKIQRTKPAAPASGSQ